jgi:hypothetical protein
MTLMLTTAAEVVVLLGMLGELLVKRHRMAQRSLRPLRV